MKGKLRIAAAAGALFFLTLAICFFYGWKTAHKDLEDLTAVDFDSGYVYGIFDRTWEDSCLLVRQSLDGDDSLGMKLPLKDGDARYEIQDVSAAGNGLAAVLVHCYEDERYAGAEAWLCDLEKRSVRTVFSKSAGMDEIESFDLFACGEGLLVVEFQDYQEYEDGSAAAQVCRTVLSGTGLEELRTLPPLSLHSSTAASYQASVSHGIWYLDRYGNAFHCREDSGTVLVFSNNGEQVSINNTGMTPVEQGVYFYNLDEEQGYLVGEDGTLTPLEIPWLSGIWHEGSRLQRMFILSDETMVAVMEEENEPMTAVVGFGDGHTVSVRSLMVPVSFWIGYVILGAAVCTEILAAAAALLYYVYTRVRVIPVAVKVGAVMALLIFGGGYHVLSESLQMLYERQIENGKTLLMNAAVEEAGIVDGERFCKDEVDVNYFDDRVYEKQREIEWEIPVSYGYFKVDGQEEYPISDMDYVTTPAAYVLPGGELPLLEQSSEGGLLSVGRYFSSGREYLAAYAPVCSAAGEVKGVVKCSLDTQFLKEQAAADAVLLSFRMIVGFAAVVGAALVLLHISLRPLKQLQRFLTDMERNGGQSSLIVKGHNEISDLTAIFSRMSENIRDYMEKVMAIQKKYEPFVPGDLIALMGKADIREVKAGDKVSCDAALLLVELDSFEELKAEQRSDLLFESINQALGVMIPCVRESGGQIVRFERGGLLALFPGDALAAADTLFSIVNRLRFHEELRCHGALDYRKVTLEIMGSRERMDFTICTEDWQDLFSLVKMARNYELGIIATKPMVSRLDCGGEHTGVRCLGEVWKKTGGTSLQIFELLEKEEEGSCALKRQTRELFEKGVDRFLQGLFDESRECFVEILKINHRDTAARRYFDLCDWGSRYFDEMG